jgi:carboxypeptidase Taq
MNSPAYADLTTALRRNHLLGTVGDLLGWDEQVNLPPGSAGQRAAQMALLAELGHAAASDPRFGAWLHELEAGRATLTADEQVVVRQARRDFDRVTRLPAEFVREKATLVSEAYHAWAQARAKSDFPGYAPFLEKHLELAKREAAYLGRADAPYDYFIDQHDPGLTAGAIGRLFAELKKELVPLGRAILVSPVKPRTDALRGFPVEGQRAFLREVTERLGFDYQRGRIDVALHPFCSGTGADTRMTTRFNVDEPLDSLFSSVHETGHGLYEQGLPAAEAGTALGMHAGMAVHESQSRLWENQVARGRAFWRCFEPRFRALFPAQTAAVSSDELYLAINAVAPTLIRVDADEVTYNLHIILRFELEKKLFAGELAVRDLPEAWRAASRELIGLEPANDREGVLQDVHWSGGAFGYFPSYCLGNMMAAQLWYAALAALPGLEEDFTRGDFSRLLGWLRTHVHAEGRRYDLLALVRKVTGEELSPRPLLRYLRERYGTLYRA